MRSLLLALALVLLAAAPAVARTAPCRPDGGPTCHVWTGKVTGVNDGDTFDVDVDGDGTRRSRRVRFIALQATELLTYHRNRRTGSCHSVEATRRLERLLRAGRNRVRLTAQDPKRRVLNARLPRFAAVRIGGRWRDIGETLLAGGHAFWMPSVEQPAWNLRYSRAQQRAAARGTGVWDSDHCGRGPDQDVPLDLVVRWDAIGQDAQNVNGEWVRIRNRGGRSIGLGGWTIRNSRMRRFEFPRGTTLPAGGTVTVHVGRGTDQGDVFHWNLAAPTFINATHDAKALGDAALLVDPQGDVRASMQYPCRVDCADPRRGAVALEVQPRRQESVRISNLSQAPVDLYGLQLALPGSTFPLDAVIPPGGAIAFDDWGVDRPMLRDEGGAIRLTTFSEIEIACSAWGDGSC